MVDREVQLSRQCRQQGPLHTYALAATPIKIKAQPGSLNPADWGGGGGASKGTEPKSLDRISVEFCPCSPDCIASAVAKSWAV